MSLVWIKTILNPKVLFRVCPIHQYVTILSKNNNNRLDVLNSIFSLASDTAEMVFLD